MPPFRPRCPAGQAVAPPGRTNVLLSLCLLCLLGGCGNKGDLYLPGSEADERSLRSIDQLLDELEDDEEDATTLRKAPGSDRGPAAATS